MQGAGKIPFICIDLAGGANMTGSNVLTGGQGGQRDFLSVAGYGRLGLPGDMVPNAPNAGSATNDFIESRLGLLFHLDSAFVRGILERVSVTTAANVNGAVIPARSENDTGNNPHNPMYGIFRAGADGELLTLIGSESSESGGNSMSPSYLVDVSVRPTKVEQTSDVTGLVDTGKLVGLLDQDDAVRVMESIERLSDNKLGRVNTGITRDALIKDLVRCNYVKAADLTDRYGDPSALNPELDPDIVGPAGIFTRAEFDNDDEFRKTAAVMKMVINGYAGAGTITMGGYDYHGQGRATGELRDQRAGRCMGACLEYAARRGVPLMLYVFSDGSLSADGVIGQQRRRARQVRLVERQPADRRLVLPRLQPGRPRPALHGRQPAARAAPADRLVPQGRLDRDRRHAGGEQRQPAGRDRDPELHGPARRAGPVRHPFPGQRPGIGVTPGQPHRVQSDRQRHHCVTCAETAGAP